MAKLAVSWSNPDIILYHGTHSAHAPSILAAIDLAICRPRTDFGQGFYTTTSEIQARDWADTKVKLYNTRNPLLPSVTSEVIEFTLERNVLAGLEAVWFVRGDIAAADYWSLIRHFRVGATIGKHHQRIGGKPWYEVAVGPVAASWFSIPRAHRDMDQISFHSSKSVGILNALPVASKRQLP
jgi:Protein of unknown function (DUF3990)